MENFKTVTSKSGCCCLQQEVVYQRFQPRFFDWVHFVLFDGLACVAYSIEDGHSQGVTAT